MTRISAASQGNLERYMGEELALAEKAVTRGVADTAEQIKLALRADVIQAGLGRRLANSWRSQKYPKNRESLRAGRVGLDQCGEADRVLRQGGHDPLEGGVLPGHSH